MTSGQKALIVLIMMSVAIIWGLIKAGYQQGQAAMMSDMMADGYRVVVTRECAIGEGRYTIQVWRGGWVDVER